MSDDKPKSVRNSLAAFSRWSRIDPVERRRQMSELGKKSAASRRAAREAAGPLPPRPPRKPELPGLTVLAPYLDAVDAQPRETPLTGDARYREATLLLKLDIAAQTVAALKRATGKPAHRTTPERTKNND